MDKNEIIEMAKQAGCLEKHQVFYFTSPELEAFAKLIAAKEREICKNAVSDLYGTKKLDNISYVEGWDDAIDIAEQAIGARGKA